MKKKISIFSIYSWPIAWCVIGSFSAFLSSCQDYEPFTKSEMTEARVKNEYSNNFIATYGEIDPNQSWDLSMSISNAWANEETISDDITRATNAGDEFTAATTDQLNALVTRMGDGSFSYSGVYETPAMPNDTSNWYTVPTNTITWLENNIPESKNNNSTEKGVPFILTKPTEDFAIIPIYQGGAKYLWDLHLVDIENNVDYNIWSKSQGMIIKNSNDSDYHTIDRRWKDGNNCTSKNATSIISQPIIIHGSQLGGNFFLYLDITWVPNENNHPKKTPVGTAQRSDEGMMLALLNHPTDPTLDIYSSKIATAASSSTSTIKITGSQEMIIGCEDNKSYGSDWDLNDIVFLIVGFPAVPDLTEAIHKRYLCEDLGNTYDFDFNDIVVDVSEYTPYTKTSESGEYSFVKGETMQYATIKHLCGTLPFRVKVGNYVFPTVTVPTNYELTWQELNETSSSSAPTRVTGWEPEVKKTITGWDPKNNNIVIKVAKSAEEASYLTADFSNFSNYNKNGVYTKSFGTEVVKENDNYHYYQIGFPKNGEVPYIIAVAQTINWMEENKHIPEKWWKNGYYTNP